MFVTQIGGYFETLNGVKTDIFLAWINDFFENESFDWSPTRYMPPCINIASWKATSYTRHGQHFVGEEQCENLAEIMFVNDSDELLKFSPSALMSGQSFYFLKSDTS